jgi:hypothetical protein
MASDKTAAIDILRRARARELYDRLPEVYRARDWQRAFERYGEESVRSGAVIPELESFLGIIADEIIHLRKHIGDLWDNFFIETCDEWVVPYIAELLGVGLVFNDAQRNRVDVKNTIDWRRRKGTLPMLADLAGDITGWNAAAAEFFENLGWAQNLNHLKPGHLQAPVLNDPYPISLLGSSQDPWLHAVDVRSPQGKLGWYGLKNLGFFLSRLNAYPQRGITPHSPQGVSLECFSFDPLGRDLPLFNRLTCQSITGPEFARDPYAFCGSADGFAIRQHGILLATARPPAPEPSEAKSLWFGFGPAKPGEPSTRLDPTAGLEIMQPELFETPMRRFKITALWGNDFASTTPLGTLSGYPPAFAPGAAAASPGVLMLRLELDAGSDPALFPATVLAVRNDRAEKRASDSRNSRYRDALYVYVPEVALFTGDQLNLYVADDGSTYWARRAAPHVGPADVLRADILNPDLDRSLLARSGLGQCFPLRRLSNSFEPSDLVDLHRKMGLRLADEALFVGRQFVIEALNYTDRVGERVGYLATYDDSGAALTAFQYQPQDGTFISEDSRLIIKISRAPTGTDTFFPMTELILTERGGRALLLSLPEMDFTTDPRPVWLFFDTDGATYYASTDYGHDTALALPERGSALRFDPTEPQAGLARRSAGQVLALPKAQLNPGVSPRQSTVLPTAYPLRQRLPMYADLCHWDHPKPRPPRRAQLAIDPVRGRFRFAPDETPPTPIDPRPLGSPRGLRVDYHEGFTHDVGALTYDRYPSLKAPENPVPTRYVARDGDADCGSSPVHSTLAEALNAAIDGDVIQIEDSAIYEHTGDLIVPTAVKRLVIQAANRQRPCLHFSARARIQVNGAMDALRLNGLLISGATLNIADTSQARLIELIACSFDPATHGLAVTVGTDATIAQISLCRHRRRTATGGPCRRTGGV